MSKIYLCGITSSGNEANLKEMVNPISEHFHGLCFTFHLPKDDGAEFLEKNKGEGEIIYAKYCQRHGYSQTHFLWQGPMKNGDKFVLLDSSERISTKFCYEKLQGLCDLMDQADLACISNFGKGFLFRFNEMLEFRGSPHWYPINLDGKSLNLELDKTEFWNTRSEQREKFHWINHYAKYMLFPAGSNHALLGLEKNGDPQQLFPERERLRLDFRKELVKRGYPLTVEGVKQCFTEKLDDRIKFFINKEKVWNDFYRFHIKKEENLVDDHDFKNMIKV